MRNSGNYTVEDPNEGKMEPMTKMFVAIDAVIAILSIAILAFVYARYFKKRKATEIEVKAVEKE